MNKDITARASSNNLHLLATVLLTLIAWEVYMGYMYDQLKEDILGSTDMFTIASDNPVLRWQYRANVQVYDPVTRLDVRTNNYGFRDRDFHTEDIHQGRRRIAFVGDSVTFGLKENIEDIFVRKFEAYVNEKAGWQAVETLNFSVDGYNTLQINELLEDVVIQFKPKEIIYVMCMNDFDFDPLEGDMQVFFEKPYSFIVQAMQRLLKRVALKDIHLINYDKNKERVFGLISDMNERVTHLRNAFSVILIPAFYQDHTTFDNYPLLSMHKEIASALTGLGVKVVDLLPSFSSTHMPPGYFAHDIWHLNKAGHEHVAVELANIHSRVLEDLLYGEEALVWGDSVYTRQKQVLHDLGRKPKTLHSTRVDYTHFVRRRAHTQQ